MSDATWSDVDAYLEELLVPHDDALAETLRRSREAGLPEINVTPLQGQLLQVLALSINATRILEIGTLGGYSTIWLARSLPSSGQVVTLEANPTFADIARQNIAYAGLDGMVDIRIGPAADSLPVIAAEGGEPFDLTFIDADKPSNPVYFSWALRLSRPGSLIIVDNVIRRGAVIDDHSTDPTIVGIRRFNEMLAAETRVKASAVQTVGSKGYDGFTVALVLPI